MAEGGKRRGGGEEGLSSIPLLANYYKKGREAWVGFLSSLPCFPLSHSGGSLSLSLFLSFMLAALFRLSLLFPLFSFSLPSPSATGGNKLWPCSSSSSQREGGDVVLYFIPLLARTSPSLPRRSLGKNIPLPHLSLCVDAMKSRFGK